jgi:Ca-activated chloride channel family protein
VAVAADERDVFASYDKEQWEKKVIQEDYNRLREEVAADIRKGDQAKANERITDYRSQQAAANAVVQSQEVTRNLEEDLDQLETLITDSFSGSADEAAQKQKVNSKSLQFKSYGERRAK